MGFLFFGKKKRREEELRRQALINMSSSDDEGVTQCFLDDDIKKNDNHSNSSKAEKKKKLFLINVTNSNDVYVTNITNVVVIGKKSGKCDIVIKDDNSVSGEHCMISQKQDGYWISDCNSTNGTKLNGKLIKRNEKLTEGSIIGIGRKEYSVSIQ